MRSFNLSLFSSIFFTEIPKKNCFTEVPKSLPTCNFIFLFLGIYESERVEILRKFSIHLFPHFNARILKFNSNLKNYGYFWISCAFRPAFQTNFFFFYNFWSNFEKFLFIDFCRPYKRIFWWFQALLIKSLIFWHPGKIFLNNKYVKIRALV